MNEVEVERTVEVERVVERPVEVERIVEVLRHISVVKEVEVEKLVDSLHPGTGSPRIALAGRLLDLTAGLAWLTPQVLS